jgi:hypothetical protein
LIDCVDGQNYASELENGKACKYNYEEIFANTSCTAAKTFGYNSGKVCVLIKLNKIVSWNLEKDDQHVKITCEGEVNYSLLEANVGKLRKVKKLKFFRHQSI